MLKHNLPDLLATRLAQPGPWRHDDPPPPDAKPAAVLVLLYPREDRWHLPLTLRPVHLPFHAGQVSLPGGALNPNETSAEAALREFHEELGAAGHPIRLLGLLRPIYVRASNFRVEPWVAATESRPEMTPNPAEVEALLEVPLEHLADPANFGYHERDHGGEKYQAPHFWFAPHCIWGATCTILGELVTILEQLESGV
jgi:8-oxo-dGTP pyrophosphatase MutT (NUDIX family)